MHQRKSKSFNPHLPSSSNHTDLKCSPWTAIPQKMNTHLATNTQTDCRIPSWTPSNNLLNSWIDYRINVRTPNSVKLGFWTQKHTQIHTMAMEERLNEKRSCSIADWKRKLAYMYDIEESKRWIWGWTVEREREWCSSLGFPPIICCYGTIILIYDWCVTLPRKNKDVLAW